MAAPVASTSQPAQIPALESQHKDSAPKKAKDKKAKDATSAFPLEVHTSAFPVKALLNIIQLNPKPEYFDHRLKIFEKLKAEHDEWVKSK